MSPRGEVIDLPRGATPLDFAYHVHTSLGHRCRGARVNGRMVPLDFKLSTGDTVEIIPGKQPKPSRDWLVPQLGYLASARNRAKVRGWFRKQDEGENRDQGRQMFEREIDRLGVRSVTLPEILRELDLADADALYLGLGSGEITLAQVAGAVQRQAPERGPHQTAGADEATTGAQAGGMVIDGVGDLLSSFARCCRPVPPEPVTGYITAGARRQHPSLELREPAAAPGRGPAALAGRGLGRLHAGSPLPRGGRHPRLRPPRAGAGHFLGAGR